MEGSVLSFLKAEWKMSDTGSAHYDPLVYKLSGIIRTAVVNY
jgi:hypothetical protein